MTPDEIFYHLTKVKVKQDKLKLEGKDSLKLGYKKSVTVELIRDTADSPSKEGENIQRSKHLIPLKKQF